jgi:predicted lipoprotein with Yx(FWY)xxD motif
MQIHKLLLVAVVLGALALTGSAFGQSAHSSAATVVMTRKTSLGTILVTSSGHALYLDVADKPGHPACTGGCLTVWPPLKASGKPKAEGGAKAAYLGTIKIAHGIRQVTYRGHPLYTFSSDTKSGQTSGEGQNGFYVVSPSGSKITKSSSSGGGGGGGY